MLTRKYILNKVLEEKSIRGPLYALDYSEEREALKGLLTGRLSCTECLLAIDLSYYCAHYNYKVL